MLHNLLILSFLLRHSCQTMAEGGVGLSVEYDAGKQGGETIASLPETTLSLTDVLLMSADELRTELRIRNVNVTVQGPLNPNYKLWCCEL